MAATMFGVLADPALRDEMVKRGRIQSRKFHPNVIGEQVRSFWTEFETTMLVSRACDMSEADTHN